MPNKYRKEAAGGTRVAQPKLEHPKGNESLQGSRERPLAPLNEKERAWAKGVADQRPGYWNQLEEAVDYLRKRQGKEPGKGKK